MVREGRYSKMKYDRQQEDEKNNEMKRRFSKLNSEIMMPGLNLSDLKKKARKDNKRIV